MKSFDFKKSYEEVKINGNIYKIDLSDNKIKEYHKAFNSFYNKSQALQGQAENANADKQIEIFEKTKEIVKETIEILLGEYTFEKLYNESGGSLINIIDLIMFLTEMIKDKSEELRSNAVSKYIEKPKGKKK